MWEKFYYNAARAQGIKNDLQFCDLSLSIYNNLATRPRLVGCRKHNLSITMKISRVST